MPEALRRRLLIFSLFGASVALPILWLAYRPAGGLFDVIGYQIGRDFINTWTGPQIVARFGVMTLFDLPAYQHAQSMLFGAHVPPHAWSYPLHALFFAWPFGWLPYVWSLLIWTVLGLAAYLVVARAGLDRQQRAWAALFLLVAPSTIINVVGGQNGFYTAALLLGGLLLLEQRPWLAGILFGLLTIKPHLGVLLPFALISIVAWRAIAGAVLTATALVAASWMIWGGEAWLTFVTDTAAMHYGNLLRTDGYSYMMVSVIQSLRMSGVPTPIAQSFQFAVSLAVIATVAVTFRRTRDVPLRALLIASGTLLASPQAFNYDMPMLTLALLWVMASRDLGERMIWSFAAAWLLPAAVWFLHFAHAGMSPLVLGAVFAAATTLIWRGARVDAPTTGGIVRMHGA